MHAFIQISMVCRHARTIYTAVTKRNHINYIVLLIIMVFLAMVKDNLLNLPPLFLALLGNNYEAFLRHVWTLEGKDVYWNMGIHLVESISVTIVGSSTKMSFS